MRGFGQAQVTQSRFALKSSDNVQALSLETLQPLAVPCASEYET